MEKILVGVDGSQYSKKALGDAIKIGKKFDAEITVVNVFYPTPTPSAHEYSHQILEEARAVLENEKVKYKLVSVTDTNPSKVIIDMTKNGKFDLIVIGRRGIGTVQALVMGSVCNRVTCEAPVNVLIVK